jgi:hypothetical protein
MAKCPRCSANWGWLWEISLELLALNSCFLELCNYALKECGLAWDERHMAYFCWTSLIELPNYLFGKIDMMSAACVCLCFCQCAAVSCVLGLLHMWWFAADKCAWLTTNVWWSLAGKTLLLGSRRFFLSCFLFEKRKRSHFSKTPQEEKCRIRNLCVDLWKSRFCETIFPELY